MEIKILGICGSPVKRGNTEVYLQEFFKVAEAMGDVKTELITLHDKNINDCIHCNWCMRRQSEGKFCNQNDDMQELYPKLVKCDIMILASPSYFLRLTGRMANVLDRMRAVMEGNYYGHAMANKVGAALVVAWYRHNGLETTALSLILPMVGLDMFVVTPPFELGAFAANALSSEGGAGKFNPKERYGILKDEYGLASVRALAKKVVEKSRIVKAGIEALGNQSAASDSRTA